MSHYQIRSNYKEILCRSWSIFKAMNKRIPYYTVHQPLWSVPLNKRIEILIPGLSFQSARDANNVYPSITWSSAKILNAEVTYHHSIPPQHTTAADSWHKVLPIYTMKCTAPLRTSPSKKKHIPNVA